MDETGTCQAIVYGVTKQSDTTAIIYIYILETDIIPLPRFHNKVMHYSCIFVLIGCKHSEGRDSSIEFLSLSSLVLGPEWICSK